MGSRLSPAQTSVTRGCPSLRTIAPLVDHFQVRLISVLGVGALGRAVEEAEIARAVRGFETWIARFAGRAALNSSGIRVVAHGWMGQSAPFIHWCNGPARTQSTRARGCARAPCLFRELLCVAAGGLAQLIERVPPAPRGNASVALCFTCTIVIKRCLFWGLRRRR